MSKITIDRLDEQLISELMSSGSVESDSSWLWWRIPTNYKIASPEAMVRILKLMEEKLLAISPGNEFWSKGFALKFFWPTQIDRVISSEAVLQAINNFPRLKSVTVYNADIDNEAVIKLVNHLPTSCWDLTLGHTGLTSLKDLSLALKDKLVYQLRLDENKLDKASWEDIKEGMAKLPVSVLSLEDKFAKWQVAAIIEALPANKNLASFNYHESNFDKVLIDKLMEVLPSSYVSAIGVGKHHINPKNQEDKAYLSEKLKQVVKNTSITYITHSWGDSDDFLRPLLQENGELLSKLHKQLAEGTQIFELSYLEQKMLYANRVSHSYSYRLNEEQKNTLEVLLGVDSKSSSSMQPKEVCQLADEPYSEPEISKTNLRGRDFVSNSTDEPREVSKPNLRGGEPANSSEAESLLSDIWGYCGELIADPFGLYTPSLDQ